MASKVAWAMKLFEHPEFEQAIIRAAEHFRSRGLRESLIEKDYYVTEALRIIEQAAGDKIIFKGGTSLSKGWNLIQRFSEDVDIFLDPIAFSPPLGKRAIDRELKKLRQTVASHPALKFVAQESQTIGGFGRNDRFEYSQRYALLPQVSKLGRRAGEFSRAPRAVVIASPVPLQKASASLRIPARHRFRPRSSLADCCRRRHLLVKMTALRIRMSESEPPSLVGAKLRCA